MISVHVRGRLYVPAPERPSARFFAYLVELGDGATNAQRLSEACHWYEQACDHALGLSGQDSEVFTAFAQRARGCDGDLHERTRHFRAACGVVLSRVTSAEEGACNGRNIDVAG